jgi:uncharacterized repeat protein (TIGR03803 family)
VLHAFSAASGGHGPNADGATPTGALVSALDGFLYGTTFRGGANGWGTVFRIAPDGTAFQPLYAFSKSDGGSPAAGLILGSDGFLYGTTVNTVFKLMGDGTGFQTLHTFRDPNAQPPTSEGAVTQAALVQGQDGTLYGVTEDGGINGTGTIFQINTDGTGYQSLHSFDAYGSNTDGANPVNALIQGADGSFYGASRNGGTSANGSTYGTLFRFTPATGHTHLLWNNVDGRVMLWNVDAQANILSVTGYGPYTDTFVNNSPSNVWHATALATAPDGSSRILWNNADHRVALWNVDSQGNVLGIQGYGPYTDTFVSPDPSNLWNAVGVSVGPDDVTHLLWSNVDHRMMFWDLDAGGNVLGLTGYGPYTDDFVNTNPGNLWSATAIATGPDNVSRVVWNNVDHRVALWSLDGLGGSAVTSITGYGPYTDNYVNNDPGNLWSALGVSVGPDAVTHLLWSNVDHRMMFWDADGAGRLLALTGYGPYTDDFVNTSPGNLWNATAVATGSDGVSHVLWNNVDYRVALWSVDGLGGSSLLGVTGYGPYTDTFVSPDPGNLWSATAVSAGP